MSRKQCRRRHYPLVNPIKHAIQGAAITPAHLLDQVRILELSSIDAFATGKATHEDWRHLADMLNVAEHMAKHGIGPEALPSCAAVTEVLGDAHARYRRTGRLGITFAQLRALRDLFEFHDLQRSSISRGEYERAIKETGDAIRGKHPGVKVLIWGALA